MIRLVRPSDHLAIAAIVEPAFLAEFGSSTENALIAQLREDGDVVLEMVAENEAGEIVGHILYSRLWVASQQLYAALAPLAVRNDRQKSGVGGALMRASLETAREFGVHGILVLGHPNYYGRFGFTLEAAAQVISPYSGSPALKALALEAGAFDAPITVAYPSAFGS